MRARNTARPDRASAPVARADSANPVHAARTASPLTPAHGRCACGGGCPRCSGGATAGVGDVLRSSGRPLDGATRGWMEDRLGGDFRHVRVHTDLKAVDAAARMGARAFAFGQHIGFAAHRYAPETRAGRRLLAHELVHVLQQGSADPSRTARFELGDADGPLEVEARAMAERAAEVETRAPARVPTRVSQRSGVHGDHGATHGEGVIHREPAAGATVQDVEDERSWEPEPWVKALIGDPSLTVKTKVRAAAMSIGLIETETVSEDEFIRRLTSPGDSTEAQPETGETGLSSDEAGARMSEHLIRQRAVDKANALTGADWHAKVGSEARTKAESLYKGNPQDVRERALKVGILWAFEHHEQIQTIKDIAQTKKGSQAMATQQAATELLMAIQASHNKPLEELQYSPGDLEYAEPAWRYLGSEKAKKYLEKVGAPMPWFTTCVTMVAPVVAAAGVDTKEWGALDMFQKRTLERFQASKAWVPPGKNEKPQPGDIIIFVSYLPTYSPETKKNEIRKELSKALFQHVSVLVEPVVENADGTQKWVTVDGGKGSSHLGQDMTGRTIRRYNPATQQFVTESYSNLAEAAEGGRYLLGFWSLPRLPMRSK